MFGTGAVIIVNGGIWIWILHGTIRISIVGVWHWLVRTLKRLVRNGGWIIIRWSGKW